MLGISSSGENRRGGYDCSKVKSFTDATVDDTSTGSTSRRKGCNNRHRTCILCTNSGGTEFGETTIAMEVNHGSADVRCTDESVKDLRMGRQAGSQPDTRGAMVGVALAKPRKWPLLPTFHAFVGRLPPPADGTNDGKCHHASLKTPSRFSPCVLCVKRHDGHIHQPFEFQS